MKKLIILLSFLTVLSCSSDDNKTSEQSANKNNFVTLNGTKYYFDKIKITRNANDGFVIFGIDLQDTAMTNRLFFSLGYFKSNSVPSDYYYDLLQATYPYSGNSASLKSFYLRKYNANGTYSVISNDSDIIGKQARVIITRNSDTNYNFDINFVTALGTVSGSYSGEVEKIGF
jgi:hypothetical protein